MLNHAEVVIVTCDGMKQKGNKGVMIDKGRLQLKLTVKLDFTDSVVSSLPQVFMATALIYVVYRIPTQHAF